MSDLQARLQAALGGAYRIERELGGGGMSRVFVAREAALGRRVVVKVLPPEMAAGVNVERFRREIQLAASLQHPHIVPLLTAGSEGDLLYYVMPYVEGESLRAKLARERELALGEAVRILKDIVDALAYAHAQGVVHRDIKPENVLIARQHAVVTDFGVAKAVTASTGGGSLTSLGVALGTPAYMAPEQAAADPHVDHRADLYAAGVVGYEMVCGRPPFLAATPQATLAAQVTQTPEPVTTHRPSVPAALNALIMRCLEKHPADRCENADQLLHQLEALATPSGGMAPTGAGTPISSGTEAALRRAHPGRVTALFGAGSLIVVALIYLLMLKLGLPDWVLPVAVALLVVGLPIMLVTGVFERRRALARTTGAALPPPHGVRRWFTWRRSLLGGAAAFSGLGVATAVYMAMRLLGIGPVGTLVASGVLKNRETLILANFENRTRDSTLGPSLTEAFRVDLSQSPTVRLADARSLGEALVRMQHKADTPLDPVLAREVAEREGIKAIVAGQIDPVGRGYVLSASLVAAAGGTVLTAARETAEDDRALIGAIDRLSKKLRERVGESLITIRANAPLEKVSTASLDALRKYTQAVSAEDAGDFDRAIALLQDATTLDTGFAMAWRKLAVALDNSSASRARALAAATRAFDHRERLPEVERYHAIAYYHLDVDYDPGQAITAYRSLLERDPDNTTALNNLALALNDLHQWAEAETLALRATTLNTARVFFINAMTAQVAQGHWTDAQATLDRLDRSAPQNPDRFSMRGLLRFAERDYPATEQVTRQYWSAAGTNRVFRARASLGFAALDEVQGRLAAAAQRLRDYMAESEQRGLPQDSLVGAARVALLDVMYRNRPREALRTIDAALQRYPLASLPALDRPYSALALFYARAGRAEQAKRLLAEYEATVPQGVRRGDALRFGAMGTVALLDGRLTDAIAAFRQWNERGQECNGCGLFELAGGYDRAGQRDSAVAAYERVVSTPSLWRSFTDRYALAPTYQRLGELYEARGDRARALDYYGHFVDLWKGADPELQPLVAEARLALRRLSGEPRR